MGSRTPLTPHEMQTNSHAIDNAPWNARLLLRIPMANAMANATRETSVLLQKYLSHNAVDAYIGVHGYYDQEVAIATE